MRIVTLVISLVLALVSGLQSATVAGLGALSGSLAATSRDQQTAENISGAGSMGCVGALLWLVGAGLVFAKPKASMWIFGSASLIWIIAGAMGFSDGFLWAFASLVFTGMSWFGVREKKKSDHQQEMLLAAVYRGGPPLPPQPPAPVPPPMPPGL